MKKDYELIEEDIIIARELIKIFKEQTDNKRVVITYTELSNRLYKEYNLYIHPRCFSPYFDRIEDVCHELLHLPYITSIVVKANDYKPAIGYDRVLIRHNIISSLDTKKRQNEIKNDEIVKGQKNRDWTKLERYLDDYYGRN